MGVFISAFEYRRNYNPSFNAVNSKNLCGQRIGKLLNCPSVPLGMNSTES